MQASNLPLLSPTCTLATTTGLPLRIASRSLTGSGGQGDALLAVDDVSVEAESLKRVGDLIAGPVPPPYFAAFYLCLLILFDFAAHPWLAFVG